MSLAQLRKELEELRKTVTYKDTGIIIPETPETLRCSEELDIAREKARTMLKDQGLSGKDLQEKEKNGLICDDGVLQAHHNLLRAAWNANNPEGPQCEIKYLFNVELQECLV